MNETHYTYILASKRHGALYVGTTDDLESCVLDHKCNLVEGLTSLYAIHLLVYYETHASTGDALLRAKAIRELHRMWKLDLVEQHNPDWRDLYDDLAKAAEESGKSKFGYVPLEFCP